MASLSPLSSSSDDDAGPPPVADGVTCFHFHSPLLSAPVQLQQPDVAGSIGSKLYPAALLLCGLLEYLHADEPGDGGVAPTPPVDTGDAARRRLRAPGAISVHDLRRRLPCPLASRVVLELGAGVCGLPSMVLARQGAAVVATDLPELLPALRANLDRNATPASLCATAALTWGGEHPAELQAVSDMVWRRHGRYGVDIICCADVVYHAHLIQPLLTTLEVLTDPWPAPTAADGSTPALPPWAAPAIVLTYVQRFKRSRRFFTLLRKRFDVVPVPLEPVVDYDVLNWGWAHSDVHVHSGFANKSAMEALLTSARSSGGGGGGGGRGAGAGRSSAPVDDTGTWPTPTRAAPESPSSVPYLQASHFLITRKPV